MSYSEGDMLVLTKDIRTDAGYVLLMNGDPEVLRSDYQQVVDWQRTMFQVVEDSDSHGDGDGDKNNDHDGNKESDSDRDVGHTRDRDRGHDHDMTAAASRATSIPSNDLGSAVADTLVTPYQVSSSSSSSSSSSLSSSLQMSSVINIRRGIIILKALLSRIMTNGTILCACYLLFMSLFTIGLPFFKFAIIKKK